MKNCYFRMIVVALFGALLVSCGGGGGGGPTTYTIGGSVSGLTGTPGLVLRNNGTDDLAIASDGTFTFATRLVNAASYNVTISTQPTGGPTCVVMNNTGTVLAQPVAKVLVVCHPVAGLAVPTVAQNLFTDLSTTDDTWLALDWTAIGSGARNGITITSSGNELYYNRTDIDIGSGEAWQIEAIVSASGVAVAGELGARMWVKKPSPVDQLQHFEVQLADDGFGGRSLSLVDGVASVERAVLSLDWSTTAPRLRVRLKQQQIGGAGYILLQAEPADTFEDPANLNPVPDTNYSVKVALADFSVTLGSGSEFGFGNFVSGTYTSDWESIHVTRATDSTTPLPYWPATPPAPTLVQDDKGPPDGQVVVSYADLGSPPMTVPYLATDSATLSLVSSGFSIDDPSAAGLLYHTFTGIASGTATGSVSVCDVSQRCSTSPGTDITIP